VSLSEAQVSRYLERIASPRPAAPELDALKDLVRAHLVAVPFENLDIIWKRPIRYELEALFDKIVGRHRGGWCYELNLLFHHLLASLGYPSRFVAGRTFRDGARSPDFEHGLVLVDLPGGPWVVDVGMGINMPVLPLEHGAQGELGDGRGMRLVRFEGEADTWEADMLIPGRAEPHRFFTFRTQEHPIQDFLERSTWLQTAPESYFLDMKLCIRPTPSGDRVSYCDGCLVVMRREGNQITRLERPKQVREALRSTFGFSVTDEEAASLVIAPPPPRR
jgi:N-hydroxyarylamine O-acetyltransferase